MFPGFGCCGSRNSTNDPAAAGPDAAGRRPNSTMGHRSIGSESRAIQGDYGCRVLTAAGYNDSSS